jgi:hypothetical protein
MKHSYHDIRSRIAEPVQWYDAQGVPRYASFTPDESSNPYAAEVVLIEIACRHCQAHFQVELHNGPTGESTRLAQEIKSGRISYGEPPNHACPGDTVNSAAVKVLQYCVRRSGQAWSRETGLEVPVHPP